MVNTMVTCVAPFNIPLMLVLHRTGPRGKRKLNSFVFTTSRTMKPLKAA